MKHEVSGQLSLSPGQPQLKAMRSVVTQIQGQERIYRCKTCCLSPVAHGIALNREANFRILHILLKVYSSSTREQFPERENEMGFVDLGAVESSLKITIQST